MKKKKKGNLQHLVIRTSTYEKKVLVGIIGIEKPTYELRKIAKAIIAIPHVKGVVYGKKTCVSNSIFCESEELLEGEGFLEEQMINVSLRVSLLSFFQVNKQCAELLYREAFSMANINKGSEVLDAYCGIGTFSIFLAKNGLKVTGIESFGKSVEDANNNARRNNVEINFIKGEVEEYIDEFSFFECVFINPPRKGVHVKVIDSLIKISPRKIIYTSCDPGTLARDVELLVQGGYKFIRAVPFDMFPQTVHVETIVLLEK